MTDTIIEQIQEDIDTTVQAATITLPLYVTLTSDTADAFEFTTSINEIGQIVLTPTEQTTEFVSCDIVDITADTVYETTTTTDETKVTRSTLVTLQASMLLESADETVDVVIDDIGQIILTPMSDDNMFVTASIQDSLNLVTEEFQATEYFGYTLINSGDGWDVKNENGDIVEDGLPTLDSAKIFVCETKLKNLTESVEENSEKTNEAEETIETDAEESEVEEPEASAELIDESVSNNIIEFSRDEIEDALTTLTGGFTESYGTIRCDSKTEQTTCCEILSLYYNDVECHDNLTVDYSDKINSSLQEAVTNDHSDIVTRFLQGNISLFSDKGTPLESYIHISELDANGYSYYYDEETDAIVSYPEVD